MAKFFVNQRVRIISADRGEFEFLVGLEVIVTELGAVDDIGRFGNIGIVTPSGDEFVFFPWELEPILPEGAQPSEFSFTELMDNLGVVVA